MRPQGKRVTIILLLFFAQILLASCTAKYSARIRQSELNFNAGNFPAASKEIRPVVESASKKDKLLFLMEAGVIYHTRGRYETSNQIFSQAWNIIETQQKEISKKLTAFLLNDTLDNFYGENFERILVPFYIALNYAALDQKDKAYRWLRKMDYELKNMKYNDPKYQQNILARYLYAVVAEHLKRYNVARVQYNNIRLIQDNLDGFQEDRYVLAVKEGDQRDIQRYRPRTLNFSFDANMQASNYKPSEMGELLIIHQAGKAPVKMSRGKLAHDKRFMVALRVAIEVALRAKGAALSTATVVAMMGTASNPIPEYKLRDKQGQTPLQISLQNNYSTTTKTLFDYETTAIRNFNDHYSSYVTKNVASIATKIVVAAIAAHKISEQLEKKISNPGLAFLARLSTGAVAGGSVAATVKPDLRCWHMLPAKMGVRRLFLKEGSYQISLQPTANSENAVISSYPQTVEIKAGELKIITVRTFSKK